MTAAMNTAQAEAGVQAGGAPAFAPALCNDQRAGVLDLLRSFGDLTTLAEPHATRYQVATDARLRGQCGVEEVLAAGEAMRLSCQSTIQGVTNLVIPDDLPVNDAVTLGAWRHSAALHFRHRDKAAEANLMMLRDLRPFDGWVDRVPLDQWEEVGPRVQSCLAAIRIHTQLMSDAMECCMAFWQQIAARWDIPVLS